MLWAVALLGVAVDPAGLEAICRASEGRACAAATILESKTILEYHARERFPMQSVYKLPIGVAVLAQVDRGKRKLDQIVHVDPAEYVGPRQYSPLRDKHPQGADVSVSELVRLAVSESDGSASDVLLRLIGGPPAVMNFLEKIGVKQIQVRDTEKRIGGDWSVQYENWATPRAAVELLRALEQSRGLSHSSRDLLLKLMTETTTFPERLKGLLPAGTIVAHKTGSSGTRDGVTAASNDIGIVTLPDGRHLAIAVFVADSKADSAARDSVIAKLARAAWDEAVAAKR